MLARDEVVDHAGLQGPRSEQGDQGDDVAESIRLQPADQILHAARLELEHRRRAAALQQLIGRRVLHRQSGDFERRFTRDRPARIDVAHGPIDDRERAQSQEVEFDETRGLDVVLVELRHRRGAAFLTVERREIGQHRRGDHDAAGMRAGVTRQALEAARQIDQVAHLSIAVVEPRKLLLLLERFVERDAYFERDQLCDPVDIAVVVAEHPTDVANDGFGRQGAVGDDLRDTLATVFRGHVLDDAIAAFHAKIHVEVGHGDAFRIQEAFEQQVVFDRIQIGDAEHIGDQGARTGTATGTDRYAVLARPANEIGDDQEVPGEAHAADHAEFEIETVLVFGGDGRGRRTRCRARTRRGGRIRRKRRTRRTAREARLETLLRLLPQKLLRRAAGRHGIGRQHRGTEFDLERAALGHFDSIRQ